MNFNEVRWQAVHRSLSDAATELEVIMRDPATQPVEGRAAVSVRVAVELASDRAGEWTLAPRL